MTLAGFSHFGCYYFCAIEEILSSLTVFFFNFGVISLNGIPIILLTLIHTRTHTLIINFNFFSSRVRFIDRYILNLLNTILFPFHFHFHIFLIFPSDPPTRQ